MVKERVRDDLDFVEVDALAVGIQANGRGVANEMDIVAAGGKLDAKLGGDDAGAAVGGVAGDADAHDLGFKAPPPFWEPLRYINSFFVRPRRAPRVGGAACRSVSRNARVARTGRDSVPMERHPIRRTY